MYHTVKDSGLEGTVIDLTLVTEGKLDLTLVTEGKLKKTQILGNPTWEQCTRYVNP